MSDDFGHFEPIEPIEPIKPSAAAQRYDNEPGVSRHLDDATLAAFIAGELSLDERIAAEKHLRACTACHEALVEACEIALLLGASSTLANASIVASEIAEASLAGSVLAQLAAPTIAQDMQAATETPQAQDHPNGTGWAERTIRPLFPDTGVLWPTSHQQPPREEADEPPTLSTWRAQFGAKGKGPLSQMKTNQSFTPDDMPGQSENGAETVPSFTRRYVPEPRQRSAKSKRRLGFLPAVAAVLMVALGVAVFGVFGHIRGSGVGVHYPPATQNIGACAPNTINLHLPANTFLTNVVMASSTEGWMGGYINTIQGNNTGLVFHYQHCKWTQLSTTYPNLIMGVVNLSSPTDGWISGFNTVNDQTELFHLNGNQLQQVSLPITFRANERISEVQMVSPTEGWIATVEQLFTGPMKNYRAHLYHSTKGITGPWQEISLPFPNIEQVEAFAPGEAWIEGYSGNGNQSNAATLLLYRNGSLTSTYQFGPNDNWDGQIQMNSPQDGWLTIGTAGPQSQYQWTSRTLLHWNGASWSTSSLLNDARFQTAARVQIFSANEGMAFLTGPNSSHSAPGIPLGIPQIAGALWLHNGAWQSVPWPNQPIWNITDVIQVSPSEYWAVAEYAGNDSQNVHSGLLHFVNGSWSVYY